jgi:hypothetical protein
VESHDLPVDFQQYRTLLSVSESICAHRDLKALLQELSKRLRSLAHCEFIGLHLHDPAGDPRTGSLHAIRHCTSVRSEQCRMA